MRPGPTRYTPNGADGVCSWCGHPRRAHIAPFVASELGRDSEPAAGSPEQEQEPPRPREEIEIGEGPLAERSDQEPARERIQELLEDLQRLTSRLDTQLDRWQEQTR